MALGGGHAVLVQQRHLGGDQPGLAQAPHAPQRGRRRQPQPLGQRLVAQAGVVLQGIEQAPVDVIQFHIYINCFAKISFLI